MTIPVAIWKSLDTAAGKALLQRPAVAGDAAIRDDVSEIIAQVRSMGDAAISDLTRKFDQAELDEFRVSGDEIDAATGALAGPAIDAIDLAIANVRRFHEAQVPTDVSIETMPGVRCERVSHPIDSVGLYVPAGTAPLPSAAVMLAVPAVIAECPTCVLCTPPQKDGLADPSVLFAASRAGVRDIFKIGGAQAIAAMAYGTETVPKVDKVFGPGNAWVTCAKSMVASDPDGAAIDMPAGPSEVLVIADAQASAEFVAADLLSQAEHGIDSQVVLVTTSESFAEDVVAEVEIQIESLSRVDIARQSLRYARAIVVDDLASAVEVSNQYAPEHLILQCEDPRRYVSQVRNAGSVFVGAWTPESAGDYCTGTNHVLPTYAYARSYSGLGVEHFMRRMTIQELTAEGLQSLSGTIITLAGLEGLDAHAAAVSRRLGDAT